MPPLSANSCQKNGRARRQARRRRASAGLYGPVGTAGPSIVGADRTMIRYRPRRPPDTELRARLHELANERRRFVAGRLNHQVVVGGRRFRVERHRHEVSVRVESGHHLAGLVLRCETGVEISVARGGRQVGVEFFQNRRGGLGVGRERSQSESENNQDGAVHNESFHSDDRFSTDVLFTPFR